MPTPNLPKQVTDIVAATLREVELSVENWSNPNPSTSFEVVEREVAAMFRVCADEVVAEVLQARVARHNADLEAKRALMDQGGFRSGGYRRQTVKLMGGKEVTTYVAYYKPDLRGRPGKRRTKRSVGGVGVFPLLAVMGVWFGVSPAVAREVTWALTSCESSRVAEATLERQGIELDHKQALRIWGSVGRRAVLKRNTWLDSVIAGPPVLDGPLAGKRVFISLDGGRVRIRKPCRGRRNSRTRHHKSNPEWTEPKMIIIQVLDDKGKPDKAFRQVIDGTLGDADAAYKLLIAYLKALGGAAAAKIVLVADGADWIWNRVSNLVAQLGIERTKVTEVLDWYHAVEKLWAINRLPAKSRHRDWHKGRWIKQAKEFLFAGHIDELLAHINTIAIGHKKTEILKLAGYFRNHATRMQYANVRSQQLPIGSGAIESVVRRVVNMRVKGNAKYWCAENAEAMLMLRGYLKAGRFDDLFDFGLAQATPWWKSAQNPALSSPLGADLTHAHADEHEVQLAA